MTAANSPGAIAEFVLLPAFGLAAAYYVWLVVSAWCAHRVARAVDCAIVREHAARWSADDCMAVADAVQDHDPALHAAMDDTLASYDFAMWSLEFRPEDSV